MTPLAQTLAASPELFPAALDPLSGSVALWRLSRADYEQSAFLDGRIAPGKASRKLPFAELSRAVAESELPERCHFIFHLGHVGSTLLSRLLGKHPALFSLREPEILRTLSTLDKRRRDVFLPTMLKLWSRTFQPASSTVIKTTSFVSEIAADLVTRQNRSRAILMGVAPEPYLATIFAGANAPAEARLLAAFRLGRLNRRLSSAWQLEKLGPGEIVALGWVCETLCLAEAADAAKDRILVLDFEAFLAKPRERLRNALAHFGVGVAEAEVNAILSGGEMHSYSKAPEHRYDSETRRAVLAQGRARHASEIRQGLSWLEQAAAGHPAIAGALGFFG